MWAAGARPAWAHAREACQRQRHAPFYLGLGMVVAVAILLATGRLVVRWDGAMLFSVCCHSCARSELPVRCLFTARTASADPLDWPMQVSTGSPRTGASAGAATVEAKLAITVMLRSALARQARQPVPSALLHNRPTTAPRPIQ